jgi:1-aminocyclopropane-1-carboxylate deaminase/D-cysteine desulfhydrase-like pyridoxal-dependent ACC family enzyme
MNATKYKQRHNSESEFYNLYNKSQVVEKAIRFLDPPKVLHAHSVIDWIDRIAPRANLRAIDTPFHKLAKVSEHFQCGDIWAKRDDIGGFATAGSKVRKLERAMFQASIQGSKELVSCGPATSNTCRALAAACAELGFRSTIFLHGRKPERLSGNAWMMEQLGANVIWAGEVSWPELERITWEYAATHSGTYLAPPGVSNTAGVLAITYAYCELMLQCQQAHIEPKLIVHASATGGMAAGLNIGAKLLCGPPVISIAIVDNLYEDMLGTYKTIAEETTQLLGISEKISFDLRFDYLEEGYGNCAPIATSMAAELAKPTGIFVDPLYTGKAFAAAVDISKNTEDAKPIVFWHTGGNQGFLSPKLQTPSVAKSLANHNDIGTRS